MKGKFWGNSNHIQSMQAHTGRHAHTTTSKIRKK